jgi:hypothetical protein
MSTKIVIPKTHIKKSINEAIQQTFDNAVADIVIAQQNEESGKAALVKAVIAFITDFQGVRATQLTYADRGLLKSTVEAAYSRKMPEDEKTAKQLANKQWGEVRKSLEAKPYEIEFLDQDTKGAVKKADTRQAEKEQVAIINEIKQNNPKLTTIQAVEDHSKNVKALTSKALTDSAKKSLVKRVDDSEYQLTEKRDSLKNMVACLKFPVNDSNRTDQLKKIDLKKLVKLEKSVKDLLGS